MRAKAGDPPRNMPQKVLAGRSEDPLLRGEVVAVKVDQVVLAREPNRALAIAAEMGMKKPAVETAVAYDTHCITREGDGDLDPNAPNRVSPAALGLGVLIARAGIGFPAAVHLERFASPARLAITDEPRLCAVGGGGMLSLLASPTQLAGAMTTGIIELRPPRSVEILLSGRIRPFVCVRDVALELIRRGLAEIVARVDAEHQAPVVLEFAGPSARLLSVQDRAVLCALAPQVGAASAVFLSDEKTEVFLRDQRRSKAHRTLVPDPGAPCDEVLTVDLSAVDPLIMDEEGKARPVRDLADRKIEQVILGGDSGVSLRDMLAAAALLKSKRVPSHLDLLLAPPSRQVLEVLARSGALVDLIATGARLLEPDPRILSGELYPPIKGASLRTFDPEPSTGERPRAILASAETLAYAVAYGKIGDPRSFKRPVRVTVPRSLPTDDVLVVRKPKSKAGLPKFDATGDDKFTAFESDSTLAVTKPRTMPEGPSAMVLLSLDDVRWAVRYAPELSKNLRAVVSEHIPTGMVPVFAGVGILALVADSAAFNKVREATELELPAAEAWNGSTTITATAGEAKVELQWLATEHEQSWTRSGRVTPVPKSRGPR